MRVACIWFYGYESWSHSDRNSVSVVIKMQERTELSGLSMFDERPLSMYFHMSKDLNSEITA